MIFLFIFVAIGVAILLLKKKFPIILNSKKPLNPQISRFLLMFGILLIFSTYTFLIINDYFYYHFSFNYIHISFIGSVALTGLRG